MQLVNRLGPIIADCSMLNVNVVNGQKKNKSHLKIILVLNM